MTPLSLLYVAEILAGLKYKAVHLTANFGQLIARSNAHDTKITALEAGEASAVARLGAIEGDVTEAQANITSLQASLEGSAYKVTSSPHTIDIDHHATITIDRDLVNPVVRLPYAGGRAAGLRVFIYGDPSSDTPWTLEVENSSSGVTGTYYLLPGANVKATLVISESSSISKWVVDVDRASVVSSHNIVTSTLALSQGDIETGALVVKNTTISAIIVTLPAIANLGTMLMPVTVDAVSTGDITIKAHASDGGATLVSLTTNNASAHYLLAANTYTSTWQKVALS